LLEARNLERDEMKVQMEATELYKGGFKHKSSTPKGSSVPSLALEAKQQEQSQRVNAVSKDMQNLLLQSLSELSTI